MIGPLSLLLASPAMATVPPPPPPPGKRILTAWLPGEVRCDGAVIMPTAMRRPFTALAWGIVDGVQVIDYRFAIDGDGRTTGIRRDPAPGGTPFAEDVAPSLAVSRFAPGAARRDCRVRYTLRQGGLADAPLPDVISYSLMPLQGPLPEAGWARIRAGGDCDDRPRPEPLVQVSPDYRALPGTPGVSDWTLVSYALSAAGKPIAPEIEASTGNRALEAAALRSAAASRYTAGTPRRGCLQPYRRAASTMPPPPMPEEDAFRPAAATCPSRHDWSRSPTLTFPPAYARRSIEGWAIVIYDVAPWGEIGNVRVAAAEPSEDFGTQAIAVVRSARVPTTQGLTGCVDRVRFRMPAADEPLPPAPPIVSALRDRAPARYRGAAVG